MISRLLPILVVISALLSGVRPALSTDKKALQDDVSVLLSKTKVLIPCICDGVLFGSARSSKESLEEMLSVRIKLTSGRSDQSKLSFNYQVTGGKILGQGDNAVWDFSNTAPGKYTITIYAVDTAGRAVTTIKKEIEVVEIDCHCPCECPTLVVTSNYQAVKPGNEVRFALTHEGPFPESASYNWRVKNGTIKSGQQTREIVVSVAFNTSASHVTADVEIKGFDPFCSCNESATGSVPIGDQTVINRPANVTDLKLEETELVLACSPGMRPAESRRISGDMVIEVSSSALDPDNDILTYSYLVTGGKITGNGSNVKWDLTDVLPGTYSITVGADDGSGSFGKTASKTVTVTECEPTCVLVDCPTIALTESQTADNAGEYVVTAKVSGGNVTEYGWTVSNGEIVSGQGTPSVTIKVPQDLSEIIVTVNVNNTDESCIDSESIVIRRTQDNK